jgi:purine-binding chemotaxis protein CheW
VTADLNRAAVPSRVCLITISGELFAVDLRNVREVFPLETVTPMPGMPPILFGVTNHRGMVVPLVDLRLLLELPAAESTPPLAVVIHHGGNQIGVLVDQIPEIVSVEQDQFLQGEQDGLLVGQTAARVAVTVTLRLEGRTAGFLDIPLLLAQLEMEWTAA